MKKNIITTFLSLMCALCCLIGLAACGDDKNKVSADGWSTGFTELASADNLTIGMGDNEVKLGGAEIRYGAKMAANEVVFSYENSKYYRYLKEGAGATWVKDSITKQDFEDNFANYRSALIGYSSLKDDYNSFTYAEGTYTCASLDKTEAFGGAITNVSVTFENGKVTSVVFTSGMDGVSAQYTLTNVGSTDIILPEATIGHIHDLETVPAVEPSCETAGNVEYWECKGCHGCFSDSNGNVAIKRSDVEIAPLGHRWSTEWQKDASHHWHECSIGCEITENSQKGDYSVHTFDSETHYCECGKKDPSYPTEGLTYRLDSNGTGYVVIGIGTANDTELIIPSSYNNKTVREIDREASKGCTSFTSVTIPGSVRSIAKEAFASCSSLTSITVDESNATYSSVDGNLYSKDGTTLVQYAVGKTAEKFTIPDGVTSIGDYAFV